ncbi:phage tail assembly protein [Azospirillum sp. Sh1]|uniref:phage tail assembly protein n=1 Tax=Azospirillum sp. Sh1 TaxID=2607285 RepID=UPI0011EF448B|nr:phage tail assembly protein [Azospirillum sp. Sh1]KAA0571062.1 phage tail assembly protein [Azospirillum sp. Sh1]
MDITLSRPLKTTAGEVTTLTMREPLVEDHLASEEAAGPNARDARVEATLFAMVCGVAPEDIGRLPMKDYKKLQDAYRSFMS